MSDLHTDWIASQLVHVAENLTQEIQKVPPVLFERGGEEASPAASV